MTFDIERVPTWAHNWCYYFLVLAVVAVLSGILGFFMTRNIGVALVYLIATIVPAATGMTLFWMCRTALRPDSRSGGCGASPWYGVP
jgi:hypothetical protein